MLIKQCEIQFKYKCRYKLFLIRIYYFLLEMYIAFKWLVGLCLAMWIVLCCIDSYVQYRDEIIKKGNPFEAVDWDFKNISQLESTPEPEDSKNIHTHKYSHFDVAGLHYVMFFAGAIAVTLFNRKTQIMLFTKNTLSKIDICATLIILKRNMNHTALVLGVASKHYLIITWGNIIKLVKSVQAIIKGALSTNVVEKHKKLNVLLLQKLKEFGDERKNLGQLLIAAVNENKNLRMQHQLEAMAKNRLARHIEDTQKKIKENRTKYVSFQQLYLVTHQENMFLKARIRKLTQEKENAERDLMTVMNKVFSSKNKDLKEYCSRFIVKPDDNLLNSDVRAEVQKFMQKSQVSTPTTSWHDPATSKIQDMDVKFWSQPGNKTSVTELIQDDLMVPLASDAPRLKGLPGECIWTVKDQDGMIEKLYEYDIESDFDNGDTIRRIREYSVYYDKDCLLDFSRSRTVMRDPIPLHNLHSTNERFLTGSEAFKKFLLSNKYSVKSSKTPAPPLLCG